MVTTRLSRPARVAALGLAGLAAAAGAAPSPVEPTLSFNTIATDNSNLSGSADRQSDLIGELDAGLLVQLTGPRLHAAGNLGLQFIGYAHHTEPDAVLPRGRLDFGSTLVDQALFLDGGVGSVRTRSDPWEPQQLDSASTANTVATTSARLSPYFNHDFSPTVNALVRSDTVLTHNTTLDAVSGAVPTPGSLFESQVARLTRKPEPFGVYAEFSHQSTSYMGEGEAALSNDSAVVGIADALDTEVLLGLLGGRDHTSYAGQTLESPRYGMTLAWRPSARASLDADVEHRYFGSAWDVHARDRQPLWIVDFGLQRTATASVAATSMLTPDSDPEALLDSLLSSQVPVASDREAAVDDLVATRDLPPAFAQPVQVLAEAAQRLTRATLALIANGVRNTLYASAYFAKATPLAGETAVPGALFDSSQWGGTVGLYHRLTPQLSCGADVTWSRLGGLGAQAGESTKQAVGALSMTQRLTPLASWSWGVRHFSARVLELPASPTNVVENEAFVALRAHY